MVPLPCHSHTYPQVLLLGGAFEGEEFTAKNELVDLSDSAGTLTCPPVPDLPVGVEDAVASSITDIPLVCGGIERLNETTTRVRSTCYSLEDGAWNELGDMQNAREERKEEKGSRG